MLTSSNLWMAAQEIANVQIRYAKKGLSMSEVALCGSTGFIEWQHYPSNDLVDKLSGYEFYYHSHSNDEMPRGEHGHFHLFKRSLQNSQHFHHLMGIALDQKGLPVRIFTTNEWVTGEVLVDARSVLKDLKNFDISAKGRMGPLSRWVSAFTKLFYLQMEALLLERDCKLNQMELSLGSRRVALSSKKYHVLSECKIDLMVRLTEYLLATPIKE